MRTTGFLLLTVILTATAGGVSWRFSRQSAATLTPESASESFQGIRGEHLAVPQRRGTRDSHDSHWGPIALCSQLSAVSDAGPALALDLAAPRPVMRRLPPVEVLTERGTMEHVSSSVADGIPAAFPNSECDSPMLIVPNETAVIDPIVLTNPNVILDTGLPVPPSANARADGPTLKPLEIAAAAKSKADTKIGSDQPFLGVQNFDRSMEVDAEWIEKTAAQPTMDPQEMLSVRLPREVVARTESMLKDATSLANRGARFAARKQFEKIMRVTCQSLDAQIGRPAHSLALARGLRAIEEAEDFGLNGDSAESDLNLGGFIAGHDTPVLKEAAGSEVTALLAMQAYYRYAVEQLAIAGNNEAISSKALFSLGRTEALLSIKTGGITGGGPKALAFYHAALAVNPRNGRAANELGVMLARRGQLPEARNMFLQAATTQPTAILNLSKVYEQMGDARRAQQFSQQAKLIAARNPAAFRQGPEAGVRWVDQSTFLKEGAGSDFSPSANAIHRASSAASLTRPNRQASSAVYQAPKEKTNAKPKFRMPFGWGK